MEKNISIMRIFNISNIICINLNQHSLFQIFSVSEWYNLDFEVLVELKDDVLDEPGKFNGRIWIDLESMEIIAYQYKSLVFETNEKGEKEYPLKMDIKGDYESFGVVEVKKLEKITPIKTPKIIKDKRTFTLYKYFIKKGYNIQNDAMDASIDKYENKLLKENIKKLKHELEITVQNEHYEKAAEIRDLLKKLTI